MLFKILIGWAVTIPLAMAVTIICYYIIMPQYGYGDDDTSGFVNATNVTCW